MNEKPLCPHCPQETKVWNHSLGEYGENKRYKCMKCETTFTYEPPKQRRNANYPICSNCNSNNNVKKIATSKGRSRYACSCTNKDGTRTKSFMKKEDYNKDYKIFFDDEAEKKIIDYWVLTDVSTKIYLENRNKPSRYRFKKMLKKHHPNEYKQVKGNLKALKPIIKNKNQKEGER